MLRFRICISRIFASTIALFLVVPLASGQQLQLQSDDGIETLSHSRLVSECLANLTSGRYEEGGDCLRCYLDRRKGWYDANVGPQTIAVTSESDIVHGRQQLQRFLADRPKAALYESREAFSPILKWTTEAFAGKFTGFRIYWVNDPPPHVKHGGTAASFRPVNGSVAAVVVASATAVSDTEMRDLEFEELWSMLVFELHNLKNTRPIPAIEKDVLAGRCSRDLFIEKIFMLEALSNYETQLFYLNYVLPFFSSEKTLTDPTKWYVNKFWMRTDIVLEELFPRGSYYPWEAYGARYDKLVAKAQESPD